LDTSYCAFLACGRLEINFYFRSQMPCDSVVLLDKITVYKFSSALLKLVPAIIVC
jgi:hypothetical protein